ncbi:uncharacterized protein LOC111014659 [Momordica charantia]|uniref:Uncharacterized protein LOC111014659 n=1 Tax=Momordica charantia TaxID=3673 RepID=A0A6J1CUC3_MOMCH|nr:uncharacterized protein LOC111014659 [Momordica charantia]
MNQVLVFDGEHYEYWQSQMETIFISQDLWEIIEEDNEDEGTKEMTPEQEKEFKKNKRRNALALRLIQQGVSKSIFPRIFGIKKAKDAWEILQKEFQGSQKIVSIKLQSLWRDFDNLAMKESENIREFFSRVAEIINQMKNYGETIPKKRVNKKVLRSLPPKLNHVVTTIEESKDFSKLTILELLGSLQAHEERLNKCPTQAVEQAFHTKLNFAENKTFKSNHQKR